MLLGQRNGWFGGEYSGPARADADGTNDKSVQQGRDDEADGLVVNRNHGDSIERERKTIEQKANWKP